MKNFYVKLFPVLFILSLASCNQISQGEQREKLQYLYGLKLQLTLLMDESFYLNSDSKLKSYKLDTRTIRNTVENSAPPDGWTEEKNFRDKFLKLIDNNLATTDSMLSAKDSINYKSNQTLDDMRLYENNLMEELDALISKVGRG